MEVMYISISIVEARGVGVVQVREMYTSAFSIRKAFISDGVSIACWKANPKPCFLQPYLNVRCSQTLASLITFPKAMWLLNMPVDGLSIRRRLSSARGW